MNRLRLCVARLVDVKTVNYESCRQIKRWVSPTQKELTRRKKRADPQPEPKRSNFLEWNRTAELYAFTRRLSEEFDTAKLDQAFTHKSYVRKEEERLKELEIGDAVSLAHNEELIERGRELALRTSYAFLQNNLKEASDDAIKSFCDYLLSQETLASASVHIGTRDIILTEEHPVDEETLANTFLAIVAALEESTDTNRAANFVKDFLIVALAQKDLAELWTPEYPVEYLDELLAKRGKSPAEPRIIAQTARNTLLPVYHVGMYSDREFLGSGFGESLKEAKDVAALNAIFRMYGLTDSSPSMDYKASVNIA